MWDVSELPVERQLTSRTQEETSVRSIISTWLQTSSCIQKADRILKPCGLLFVVLTAHYFGHVNLRRTVLQQSESILMAANSQSIC